MSAQPAYKNSKAEEYAFYRRRDHANIEAMQNIVIARLAERSGTEMPPNVRHLLSAIQGAHGGGQVPFEEFSRDYLSIGRQLQFTGNDDAIRQRVRRWVDELDAWQFTVGYQLLVIHRGGQVIGTRPDGSAIRKKTAFIDYLKPHADAGVQRAQKSDQWRGNKDEGIKPHPGKALEAQADSVIAELPKLGTPEESGRKEKGEAEKKPLHTYATEAVERFKREVEKCAVEIEKRGGDGGGFARGVAESIMSLAASLKKTERARRDDAALSIFDADAPPEQAVPPVETSRDATANVCDILADSLHPDEEGATTSRGDIFDTHPPSEAQQNQQVENPISEDSPDFHLNWALAWAENGIPVIPLNEVYDGICTCPCRKECRNGEHVCGSECRSQGKHPRWNRDDLPNGAANATTDPEQIRKWWARWPTANIGGAMAGKNRILGFDVDPRNGGDASFHDLLEAYGPEWAVTLRNRTGSGGFHLFFTIPEGLEIKVMKKQIAPGIDLKWKNGLMVLPPSGHSSGNRYEVIDPYLLRVAHHCMIDELIR